MTGPRRPSPRRLPSFLVVAPRWLDPLLVFAERVDRRRRRIRRVRADGVIGIELARYHERTLTLRDGTQVKAGDRVALVHLENDRVRALSGTGWPIAAWRTAHADLRVLSDRARSLDASQRPVAFRGQTILVPFIRREGWEIMAREPSIRTFVDNWFMRWLLAHWRGERGRHVEASAGVSVDAWLSFADFVTRYGADGRPRRPGLGAGDRASPAADDEGRRRAATTSE